MTLPDKLKILREAAGLSQENAARRVPVTANTWSRWERGMKMAADRAPAVAAALGVSVRKLYEGVE